MEKFDVVKFHLNNVKKSYKETMKVAEERTIEITITERGIILEEENSCGSTLINYNYINSDFSGMVGYLGFYKLSDFMFFVQCVERAIAVDKGITIEDINKWLKEETK